MTGQLIPTRFRQRGSVSALAQTYRSKQAWLTRWAETDFCLDVVFSSHYSLHIGTDYLCVSNDIVVRSMAMILNHFFFSNSSYIGQNIPRRSILMTNYFIFIINKNFFWKIREGNHYIYLGLCMMRWEYVCSFLMSPSGIWGWCFIALPSLNWFWSPIYLVSS